VLGRWLGLTGPLSLLSYLAALVFSPLAYPGYVWASQAVSDLSATGAPSLWLWDRLASLYGPCGIVCATLCCLAVQGSPNQPLRLGIGAFAVMNWVSAVGYAMFPLSESGFAGAFEDVMHLYVVTVLVVLLSIVSLALICVGGYREKAFVSLANWAAAALLFRPPERLASTPPQWPFLASSSA
jgi:hypothetical membrane protein